MSIVLLKKLLLLLKQIILDLPDHKRYMLLPSFWMLCVASATPLGSSAVVKAFCRGVRKQQPPPRYKPPLSDDDRKGISKLINHLSNVDPSSLNNSDLRSAASLVLMIECALRPSDLCCVLRQIEISDQSVKIRLLDPKEVKLSNRTDRVQVLEYSREQPDATRILQYYMDKRPVLLGVGRSCDYLFFSLIDGKPLQPSTVSKRAEEFMEEQGVSFKATELRSIITSMALAGGATPEIVQNMGRWSSADVMNFHYVRTCSNNNNNLSYTKSIRAACISPTN